MKTLNCFSCGSAMSTPVPSDTVVRGTLECPECTAKYAAHIAGVIRDLREFMVQFTAFSNKRKIIENIIDKLKVA